MLAVAAERIVIKLAGIEIGQRLGRAPVQRLPPEIIEGLALQDIRQRLPIRRPATTKIPFCRTATQRF